MEFRLKLPKSELQKITSNTKAMRDGAVKGLRQALYFFEAEAKKGFVGRPVTRGSGAPLKVRTGHLRRGIKTQVKERSGKIEGSIYDNVVYAAAIEFGYSPRNLPPRPFIAPVLEDKNNIIEGQRIIIREIGKERSRQRR